MKDISELENVDDPIEFAIIVLRFAFMSGKNKAQKEKYYEMLQPAIKVLSDYRDGQKK